MAMSFPRMTRISSLSVRWEEATTGQLRYPSGMVTPNIGDARSLPAFAGIGRSCASARRNTPRNRTARGANDRMIFPVSALSGRAFDLRYYTSIRNRRVRSPSVAGVGPRWYNPPSWIRGRKVAAGEEPHAPSLLSRRGRLLFLRARHHPPSRTGRGQVRGDPPGDARLRGLRDPASQRRRLPGEAPFLLLGNRSLAAAVRGDRVRDGGCACGPAHRGGGGGDRGRARKGATPLAFLPDGSSAGKSRPLLGMNFHP